MTMWCIGTLLIFQILFTSKAKFSFFVNFFALVLGTLFAKWTAISITSAVLFCLSMGAVSVGSDEIYRCISYDRPVQIQNLFSLFQHWLWFTSTVFLSRSLYFMTVCWWIIFASWLCLSTYAHSDSDEHPAIMSSFISPTLLSCICRWRPFLSSYYYHHHHHHHHYYYYSPSNTTTTTTTTTTTSLPILLLLLLLIPPLLLLLILPQMLLL